jgi:predicted nuclease of restriction endonuclease-like (RecB) superfamily
MGEATFYLKMQLPKRKKTEVIKQQIQKFFEEGRLAESYWQEHRELERTGKREDFWKEFQVKFPQVYKYFKLGFLADKGCDNALANALDFGSQDEIVDHVMVVNVKRKRIKELWYHATVWHFADWDLLMAFLKDEFGLSRGRWLSDEYIEPFDLL